MEFLVDPCAGAVYNVVDDDPASRSEVMAFARKLLGMTSAADPGNASPQGGMPAKGRWEGLSFTWACTQTWWHACTPCARMQEHVQLQRTCKHDWPCGGMCSPPLEEKRVRNDLIKQELGVQLAYPTYREGLRAIHAGCMQPFTSS